MTLLFTNFLQKSLHICSMNYLIVGLGNIGEKYVLTRHNIGFIVVESIALEKKIDFIQDRHAYVSMVKNKGKKIYMIKPTTYMNLSGKAVRYWMQNLKIPIENTLTIVDDIALPFGSLRLRKKGSSAGHNGLKDIEDKLGHNQYPRLKFGVGNDFPKGMQAEYVLSNFYKEEQKELPQYIKKAISMIYSFASVGVDKTMSLYND